MIASLTSCSVPWRVVPSPRRQPSPDWSNLATPPALDQSQLGDGAAGPCALLSAYGACTEKNENSYLSRNASYQRRNKK